MKLRLLSLGILLTAISAGASEEMIGALLRSMADGRPVPTDEVFFRTANEDSLSQLSVDDIKNLLPMAKKLLEDPRPEARRDGLACFWGVTLRHSLVGFLDSTDLLEPYVADLLRIADDHSNPLRSLALQTLSNTKPSVSPKTLAYLSSHLADKSNTAEEAAAMAWTLLKAESDPLTHEVIAFVRKQNDPKVTEAVLRCFQVLPATKNSDALDFIGSSLNNPDVWVRRRAVEAIERLPMVARSPFLGRLLQLATDPNEPTEIRSAAEEALQK
jgi:HEAT repeat protein